MYNFKKTIEGTDIHTAGMQKELIKHYAHPSEIDLDNIKIMIDVGYDCAIEFRTWGVKDVSLYTTELFVTIGVYDDSNKSKEWELDLTDWDIEDEHLTEGVVGKMPDSAYLDFNKKIITIYYQT